MGRGGTRPYRVYGQLTTKRFTDRQLRGVCYLSSDFPLKGETAGCRTPENGNLRVPAKARPAPASAGRERTADSTDTLGWHTLRSVPRPFHCIDLGVRGAAACRTHRHGPPERPAGNL